MARMSEWAQHPHYHVRRLVSEGTRPKLPWGQSIGITHAQTFPLLDVLYADPTRFVTRSVANHLNDISKIDPDAVIKRLETWQAEGRQSEKELLWMRKHALRGLVKAGHAGALLHLGYRPDAPLKVEEFAILPNEVLRGETVMISTRLTPQGDGPLMIDYLIDFVKANGTTAPKVFKMKATDGRAGKEISIEKRHHFKDQATTFKLYPGAHQLHLQVNGAVRASVPFTLS